MLEMFARMYVRMPERFSNVAAIIICMYSTKQWIQEDTSSPVILLIMLQLFIIYPIVSFVLGILSILLCFICSLYIAYKDNKKRKERGNCDDTSQGKEQHKQQYKQQSPQNKELDEALQFYGLSVPFTEQQLRERRRQLMKRLHPDAGGSHEDAEIVNRYFEVLKNSHFK